MIQLQICNDAAGAYNTNNQIKFKTTTIKTNTSGQGNAYILAKGRIVIDGTGATALVWVDNCVMYTAAAANMFPITNIKLFIPVVTLATQYITKHNLFKKMENVKTISNLNNSKATQKLLYTS